MSDEANTVIPETEWIESLDAGESEHADDPTSVEVELDTDGYDGRDDPAARPVAEDPPEPPLRGGPLFPISKAAIPSWLTAFANGRIPAQNLIKVAPLGSGYLIPEAAARWRSLQNAAQAAGFNLTMTGAYRSYDEQVSLFSSRYSTTETGESTKTWNGQKFWLKRGMSMAAVPGTSNHGWGAAVDTALGGYGAAARPVAGDGRFMEWILAHAAEHGWSWEVQSEPWHLRIVAVPPQVSAGYQVPAPTLELGARGGQVGALQNLCSEFGWGDCGRADGDFGPRTRLAVIAMQSMIAATPDGQYGPRTAAALTAFLATPAATVRRDRARQARTGPAKT